MCDLVSAAAVVTILSGGLGAVATIQQGKAQERIAKDNARLQRIAAKDAIDRGQVKTQILAQQVGILKGRQRAKIASGLIELDTGSALDILEDTARAAEFERLTITANADREAFGLLSAAEISEFQGEQFRQQSQLQAGATILGSGSRATGFLALNRGAVV